MKIRCLTADDLPRAAAFTAAEGWSRAVGPASKG
jgi:hypothetical protein